VSTPDLQRLLTAPILPTLLRLAAPNTLAMVMTVLVGVAMCAGQVAAGASALNLAATGAVVTLAPELQARPVSAAAMTLTPWGLRQARTAG
jgi:hypothetical protein